jgi:hypothetical protein
MPVARIQIFSSAFWCAGTSCRFPRFPGAGASGVSLARSMLDVHPHERRDTCKAVNHHVKSAIAKPGAFAETEQRPCIFRASTPASCFDGIFRPADRCGRIDGQTARDNPVEQQANCGQCCFTVNLISRLRAIA